MPQNSVGIVYGLLATGEDWQANGDQYRAMLAYARSYQYFASETLQHTLFFNGWYGTSRIATIPYPAAWTARALSLHEFMIAPDGKPGDQPFIRLVEWQDSDDQRAALNTQYGLAKDAELSETFVSFSANGRRGMVGLLDDDYMIEISAPEASYDQWETLFNEMVETIRRGAPCQGAVNYRDMGQG